MKKRILKSYRKLVAHPNPWIRRLIGGALVLGGVVGPVLPILGLWMLPLGMIVLIIDLPRLRPMRRRYNAWWRNKLGGNKAAATEREKPPVNTTERD